MPPENQPNITPMVGCDEIEIVIGGVVMRVVRRSNLYWPHEVSAFLPRAEIRHRRYQEGKLVSEDEMILNSLTIVHAPLHPPAENQHPPAAEPQPYVAVPSPPPAAPKLAQHIPEPSSSSPAPLPGGAPLKSNGPSVPPNQGYPENKPGSKRPRPLGKICFRRHL